MGSRRREEPVGGVEREKNGELSRRDLLRLAGAAGLAGAAYSILPVSKLADLPSAPPLSPGALAGFKIDPVTEALRKRAKNLGIDLVWDRWARNFQPSAPSQATCINCQQGPCVNINLAGTCGISKDGIVARNLLQEAGRGASAHIGHARRVAQTLKGVGDGTAPDYSLTDTAKLAAVYAGLGLSGATTDAEKAEAVANATLEDLSRLEGGLRWLQFKANAERQGKWGATGILPGGGFPEISEAFHSSSMGVNGDWVDLLLRACKMGLIDGYGGLHAASNIHDILFGTPGLVSAKSNLTTLKPDQVNIVVNGHVPLLAERIVARAKARGGVNVVGMCCTGNEVLMRHGVNIAGDYLQQELAIVTGAVDAMVVDIQCVMPALANAASYFHTQIVTTDPIGKIANLPRRAAGPADVVVHNQFDPTRADAIAQEIVDLAVANRANRGEIYIPNYPPSDITAGFSTEMIVAALNAVKPGDPIGALVGQIANGNIRGIVAVIGCVSPRDVYGYRTVELIRELLANNVLVVVTGCIAPVASYYGLLKPDPSYPGVGSTLAAVLDVIAKANGLPALPPCLHMGSCADNSRIEEVLNAVAGYLGVRIDQLPVAGSAPEYIAEKAVAIAFWAVCLGLFVHIGDQPNVAAGSNVVDLLTSGVEGIFGGKLYVQADPHQAAQKMLEVIQAKRTALGI